jgi:hypothetical protein
MNKIILRNGFFGIIDILPEGVKLNTVYRDQRGNILWFMKDMNQMIHVNYKIVDSNSCLLEMDPESVELLTVEFEKETVWVSGQGDIPQKRPVIKGQTGLGMRRMTARWAEHWDGLKKVHEIDMDNVIEKDGKYKLIEYFYPVSIDNSDYPELIWGKMNQSECEKLGIKKIFSNLYGLLYGVYDDKSKTFTICDADKASHIMIREREYDYAHVILDNSYAELFSTGTLDEFSRGCGVAIYPYPIENWRDNNK